MRRALLDNQPPATTITLADAASWLGTALLGVLLWVWRSLVRRVDAHDDAIEGHDDEIQTLQVAQARTEERHDALVGTVERIEKKVDSLPAEIAALLTRGRNS